MMRHNKLLTVLKDQTRRLSTTSMNQSLFRASNTAETKQIRNAHVLQLNSEKELIFRVLESIPSQREAKSYLKRIEGTKIFANASPQTVVQPNLEAKFPIALISLSAPLLKEEAEKVAQTLAQIKRLGVAPIVIVENSAWSQNTKYDPFGEKEDFRALRQIMIQDGLALCHMIEKENVKTRMISNGAFESTDLNLNNIEVDLEPVLSSLRSSAIPILLPLASTKSSRHFVSNGYLTMSALSKCFSRYASKKAIINGKVGDVMKIIAINTTGGIPDHNGDNINFVNLQDDLEGLVVQANQWKGEKVPGWKKDLDVVYSSLAYLPATTSGVVLSAGSINTVIGNLITDKPLISPSLPGATSQDTNFTVLRYGLKVATHSDLSSVDMGKLFALLEASFNRTIDKERFVNRLKQHMSHLIVAGDYQGVAIVTNESNATCYLDKFAVSPSSQGIGVADVLWQRLQLQCPNLMWRSRQDNKVNKWYFERSDGNLNVPGNQWRMFWYGNAGIGKIKDYLTVAAEIPPTFAPGGLGRIGELPPK